MRLHVLLLLLFALVLASCGGSEGSSGGSAGADPATAVPADTPVYIEAVVRPEGDQGDNARALVERFVGPDQLETFLDEALRDSESGESYEKDIKPWLGERVGIGVTDLAASEPGFAGAVAVTDTEKAEAFLGKDSEKKGEYEGTQLYQDDDTFAGVAGDFVAIADSQAGVKRIIDTIDGESLAESERFESAVDELPDERLGALYVDTKALSALAEADPDLDPAGKAVLKQLFGSDAEPITAALTAEPDAATIEAQLSSRALAALGPLSTGKAPELLRDVPADSWAVLGYSDVGKGLKETLDLFAGALGGAALTGQLESQIGINLERDVFSWMGDLALFVRGDGLASIGGALVIEVTDESAAGAAIPKLVAAAKQNGAPVRGANVAGADEAYSLTVPGAPADVILADGGDRVVLAFGEQAAEDGLEPSETIGDSGLYERAERALDGIAPATIVDFTKALALIEQAAAGDEDFAEAKPYLEKLDLIAAGAEDDDGTLRSRFTVKAK